MASKKAIEQILIIVGATCIVGLITWAIVTLILVDKTQGKTTDKIKYIENRMDKFESKQNKILDNSNKQNSQLAVIVLQLKYVNESIKELNAQVKGSYASNIECKRAKINTEAENKKIAFNY